MKAKSVNVNAKTCSRCKKRKFVDDFYKCSSSKDGYYNYCMQCTRAYRNSSKKDKQYRKEYAKKYYAESKDVLKIKFENYKQENKEKVLEIYRKSKLKHKEKNKIRDREYYLKNREEILQKSSKRRNIKKLKERGNHG